MPEKRCVQCIWYTLEAVGRSHQWHMLGPHDLVVFFSPFYSRYTMRYPPECPRNPSFSSYKPTLSYLLAPHRKSTEERLVVLWIACASGGVDPLQRHLLSQRSMTRTMPKMWDVFGAPIYRWDIEYGIVMIIQILQLNSICPIFRRKKDITVLCQQSRLTEFDRGLNNYAIVIPPRS